jgi:hypothetical protein
MAEIEVTGMDGRVGRKTLLIHRIDRQKVIIGRVYTYLETTDF